LQTDLVVMLARPELLLPLAFSLSGLMIVAALVLLRLSTRQSKQPYRVVAQPQRRERVVTMQLYSGATAATLDEATRQSPARKRQTRIYA
jgi:hypothetical protein